MQPLVPLVFHNLPSLYPPSFRRNDFLCYSGTMAARGLRGMREWRRYIGGARVGL